LLHAGNGAGDGKVDRINGGAPGKLKFLFGGQRSGVGNIADIEVRNYAEDALLLLDFELFFGHFDARDAHLNLGDFGGEREDDLRNRQVLARMQDERNFLGGEQFRGDGDLERAGSDVGKGELAIVARQHFLFGGFVVARESNEGSGDGGSRWVSYGAANASGQLLSGLLLAGGGRIRKSTGRCRGGRNLLRLSQARQGVEQEAQGPQKERRCV